MVELNEALSKMQNSEKPNVAAFLDRETNREKSVVARIREMKLKEQADRKKSAGQLAGSATPKKAVVEDEEDPIAEAERGFWEAIEMDKLKRERNIEKKQKAKEAAALEAQDVAADGSNAAPAAEKLVAANDAEGGKVEDGDAEVATDAAPAAADEEAAAPAETAQVEED